jgi:hypothetical protein
MPRTFEALSKDFADVTQIEIRIRKTGMQEESLSDLHLFLLS